MAKYRAIVSIEFDSDDLEQFAEQNGFRSDDIDPMEFIGGEMDNLSVGSGWIEQMFVNGRPQITRLSGGIDVQINEH